MPISAERMKQYPGGSIRSPQWLAIRERIRERAGDACEGSPRYPDCRAENVKAHPITGSLVVCTVAHFNHDLADNSDENLRFWCQRCHNTHDRQERNKTASATRRAYRAIGDLFTGAA